MPLNEKGVLFACVTIEEVGSSSHKQVATILDSLGRAAPSKIHYSSLTQGLSDNLPVQER